MSPIGASDEARDDRLPASLADRVAAREERFRRAHAVAAEVVTLPPAERRAFVAGHADCLCPEFVELMIAVARERRGEEPRDSVRCAHVAVTAIEAYVAAGGRDGDDLRALAWAELGNAHRICGDLRSAGTAFHYARERVRYAADPLVRAEVYSLEASYRDYRREFGRAERLLLRAERVVRRYGSPGIEGRLKVQRAEVVRCTGRLGEALEVLEQGLGMIDARAEPQLALRAIHNLAHYLILLDEVDVALGILRRSRPAYAVFADDRLRARRGWLEANAICKSGLVSLGESMLEEARQRFAELACPYEVALVSLDLAEVYASARKWQEVESVAQETLSLCRSIGVETEGIAAATMLVEVAARRQADSGPILALTAAVRRTLAPRPCP